MIDVMTVDIGTDFGRSNAVFPEQRDIKIDGSKWVRQKLRIDCSVVKIKQTSKVGP